VNKCLFILLFIFILMLCGTTYHFHNEMLEAQKAERDARKEQLKSQFVLKNTMAAVTLYIDIVRITHEDRRNHVAESEKRIARIRKEVHEDACAHQPVPSAATKQLRAHSDRIRARSRYPVTTGMAGGL